MKESDDKSLLSYSDEKRSKAVEKFKIIEPYILEGIPLAELSQEHGTPLRTLQMWTKSYQDHGLKGLIHQTRSDAGSVKIDAEAKNIVEGIALKNKNISIATICRKAAAECRKKNLACPSYHQVYRMVNNIPKDKGKIQRKKVQYRRRLFEF